MLAMYAFSVSGLNYLAHLLLITLRQQYFSPSGTKIGQLHVFLVPQLSALTIVYLLVILPLDILRSPWVLKMSSPFLASAAPSPLPLSPKLMVPSHASLLSCYMHHFIPSSLVCSWKLTSRLTRQLV